MDFMTSAVLSGIAFDIIKTGACITVNTLRDQLRNWLVDETTLQQLSENLNSLELNDDMSPKAIERRVDTHQDLSGLLSQIRPSNTNIQIHSGAGDNIMTNVFKR